MPEPFTEFDVLDRILRGRRTVERFRTAPAPRAEVLRALDAARWVPNHRLTEPWRFYLLSRESAGAIVELNAERVAREKGAAAAAEKRARWSAMPGWLVVTCVKSEDEVQQREDYAACCCATYAVLLALWAQGVGSKWSTGGVIRDPRFYEILWADPRAEDAVALVWYGYPEETPVSVRRPLDEVLIEI
jgi:nitroreductase